MAVFNFFDVLAIRPNFFDDADIDTRLNKKQLRDSILRRCGTLMPVYTNTEMFKYFSDNFFYEKREVIKKLFDTIEVEYNPIDNYDKTETVTREMKLTAGIGEKRTNTLGSGNVVTSTPNTTQTEQGNGSINKNQEDKVSAYDASDYQPKSQTTDTTNSNTSNTITNTGTITTETTQNGTDTTNTERSGSDLTSEQITTKTRGNIGVTTTQEMIRQERDIALFNIYNWIAIEFEQNFFICVS